MLFLLKDEDGRPLVIVQANSDADADRFGLRNLPTYCGRRTELDPASQREAEEFWNVSSVRVMYQQLDPTRKPAATATAELRTSAALLASTPIFLPRRHPRACSTIHPGVVAALRAIASPSSRRS